MPTRTKARELKLRVESLTVVTDDRFDHLVVLADDHIGMRRAGMLEDVRQRFLHEPVDRILDCRRQATRITTGFEREIDVKIYSERAGPRNAFDEGLKRCEEPEFVESRGAKVSDQIAESTHRHIDALARLLQSTAPERHVPL